MGRDARGKWSRERYLDECVRSGRGGSDHDLDTGGKSVRQLAYLPDGHHLVAELDDHTMRIWRHSELIVQLQGICECRSALPREQGLPFLAVSRTDETQIEDVATRKVIAWFPFALQDLRSYPKARAWRGVVFHRLHIFSLAPASYQISPIAAAAKTSRERVLLIDRAYTVGSTADERYRIVRDGLVREYEVDTFEYLDEPVGFPPDFDPVFMRESHPGVARKGFS